MKRTGVASAAIMPTPELLNQMLREKPACWTWAAFASVLFQRWAAVEDRKVDFVVGSPPTPIGQLLDGPSVAHFVGGHMRAVDDIIAEVAVFMRAPEYTEAFGTMDDEDTADAEGIVRAGHRLGDYYERLLETAEDSRRYSVPDEYASLIQDCVRFVGQPLQDFAAFIDDVLERLEVMQKRVMHGVHRPPLQPVPLRIVTDDRLLWSIMDRIQALG